MREIPHHSLLFYTLLRKASPASHNAPSSHIPFLMNTFPQNVRLLLITSRAAELPDQAMDAGGPYTTMGTHCPKALRWSHVIGLERRIGSLSSHLDIFRAFLLSATFSRYARKRPETVPYNWLLRCLASPPPLPRPGCVG